MDDNQKYGAYFVDATGLGKPADPALTLQEFVQRIQLGRGHAIVEKGKYQVKIGIFQKIESKKHSEVLVANVRNQFALEGLPFPRITDALPKKLYAMNRHLSEASLQI